MHLKSSFTAAGIALVLLSGSAFAASTINVTLNNQPITSDMPTDLGMAMPGADMSKAVMSVSVDKSTVPAGEVSFVATNKSADYIHEMIVIKVTHPNAALPYVAADQKVDEDAAGHLGEVAELDPGASGTLTLALEPGTYMLLCNVAGHYMAGMWTTITVQ